MKINSKNKIAILFAIMVISVECFGLSFDGASAVATTGNASRQIETTAYIVNSEDKEIPNGEYEIKFSIYATDRADSGAGLGTPVWQETQKVQIQNGVMDTYLGTVTALPATLNFSSGEYFLGVAVGTDAEMTPRKKIGAVSLALDSLNAESIQGATLGTATGNILQLGKGGKINVKQLPTITKLGTITTGVWEGTAIASGYIEAALTGKTYNGLTLTDNSSTGFLIANNNSTLNVTAPSVTLDQDLSTTSIPTFAGINLSGVTLGGGDLTLGAVGGNLIVVGNILPSEDLVSNIGSASKRWKTIYVGSGEFASLSVTNNISAGTLGVSGAATANSLAVTNNISAATLGVSGTMTAATLNTGHGDNELYAMNQNVLTSSTPTFYDLILSNPLSLGNGGTGISASYSAGDMLYYHFGNALNKLAIGTEGQMLVVSGGLPIWTSSINSGTWNGSVIDVPHGGTGLATIPQNGQLLIGNGTNYALGTLTGSTGISVSNSAGSITITNVGVTQLTGTANQITASASTGNITLSLPQNISTASSVTFGTMTLASPLQVASGGTGRASYTPGDLVYYASDGSFTSIGIGSALQILTVAGGVPAWSDTATASPHNLLSARHSDTTAAGVTQGAIIAGIGASPNTKWAELNLGSAGYILRSDGTDIAWSPTTNITTLGTVTAGIWNGATVDVAHGGTGATTLSANYILKGNGTSALASSMIYDNGTNVGIGNASPAYKLDVNGSINVSSGNNFLINGVSITTGGALGNVAYLDQANTFTLNNTFSTSVTAPLITSAGALAITPNAGSNLNVNLSTTGDLAVNTNQLYVDTSAGQVGIGTTTPTSKLFVAATNGDGIRIGAVGDAGTITVPLGSQTAQYNLDFSGYRDASPDQIGARISALRFNNFDANNALLQITGLAFYTNPSGSNTGATDLIERLRIAPTGNVGIGTTSPVYKLDVAGSVNVSSGNNFLINGVAITTGGALGNVAYLDQANTFTLNNTFSTSVTTPLLKSTGALAITPNAGSNLNVNLSTTGDLAVNTNQLYVDTSTGRVGIGTTSPNYILDVVGAGNFSGALSANSLSLTNALTTGNGGTGLTSYTAGDMLYYSSGTALTKLAIGTNGQVLVLASGVPTWTSTSSATPHALLSATHSDTSVASVHRGDLITGQGTTPTWNRLGIGTAGQVLVSDGTDAQWNTISGGTGGIISPDSLDFTDLADAMTLDANLTIASSVNNYSINFDSNTLYIDTANNRVGVGTATPVALLSVGATSQFQVNASGNVTGGTYNGNTITTGTGTLTLGAGKTLTLSDSATLATNTLTLGNAKILTLSDSGTLNTNAITFAGTEILTLAATKNVTFADAFSTSGAFPLTLTTTNTTSLTLPTTGTLSTLAGAETFTNKASYNGLVITANTGTITSGIWNGTSIADANIDNNITIASGTVSGATNTMSLGSDATGDIYYRNASGYLTRLAIGTSVQVLHGGTVPNYAAIVAGDITANSLDFSELKNALMLDANLTVASGASNFSINFDSDTLFIDTANNRIGLGTITPAYKLDVAGSVNVSSGNNYLVNGVSITTGGALGNVAYLDQANTFTLNNTFSTSVTTPLLKSTGALAITPNAGSNLNINLSTTGDLAVNTNQLYVDTSTGNVGIGTASPLTKFHVGAGLTAYTIPNGAGTNITELASFQNTSGTAAISVGVGDGTNNRRAGLFVDQDNGIWGLSQTYGSGNIPFVIRSASNERLRIDNNGKIGIGTITPTNILSLGNSQAQKFWIENSATDVVGRALTVAAGGTIAGTSTSNITGGQLILQSGLGTGTGDSSIAFQTGTTLTTGTTLQTMSTKMTILGNGKVGIGTITPTALFSVGSTSQFQVDASGNVTATSFNGNVISGSATVSLGSYSLTLSGNTQINQNLLTTSGVTFANVTDSALSNGVVINSAGLLGSEAQLAISRGGTGIASAPGEGQILIGTSSGTYAVANITASSGISVTNGSGSIVVTNTGVRSLLGTTNQVNVNASTGDNVTLSLPQSIATTSDVTFHALTLSTALGLSSGGTGTATAFTKGSVVFASTSGVYSQDNANFFWDETNSRLGLGTATPAGRLDLSESGAKTAVNYGARIQNIATSSTDSINKYGLYVASNGTWNGIGANNYGLYVDTPTGGTTNTTAVFAGSLGNISVNSNGAALEFSRSGVNYINATSASGSLSFQTGGANTRMTIDNAGNVGIGTTSPLGRFDMNGGVAFFRNGSGGSADTGGEIRFAPSTAVADTVGGAMIKSLNQYSGETNGDDAHLAFYTNLRTGTNTYSGLTEKMRITNTGNVGIGSTTPGARLSVVGADSLSTSFAANISGATGTGLVVNNLGNVGIGTTNPTNILSLGNSAARKFWIENSATDVVGRALTVAAGGTIAGTSTSNVTGGQLILQSGLGTGTGDSSIAFQTGTTLTTGTTLQTMSTKMTILGNGNVGIGTTGPGAKLTVNANGVDTGITEYLRFSRTGYDTSYYNSIYSGTGSGNNILQFKLSNTSGTQDAVMTLKDGNVGIGTTGPTSLLHITTTGSTLTDNVNIGGRTAQEAGSALKLSPIIQIATAAKTDIYGLNIAPSFVDNVAGVDVTNYSLIRTTPITGVVAGAIQNTYGLYLSAQTLGTNNYGAYIAGNVGIGSTTPGARLSVVGADSLSTSFAANISGATGTGLVVNNLGNVGIGTTGPLSALHVAGTTGITWGANTPSFGLATIGTSGSGGSLFVQMPAISNAWGAGFGITGTYGTPARRSIINLNAYGVNSSGEGGYGSDLAFSTTKNTTLSEVMRITTDGNVGIGTTAPTSKLQIVKDVSVFNSDTVAHLILSGLTTPGQRMILGYNTTANKAFIQSTDTSDYRDLLLQPSGGNVGIGTTSPGAKLDVVGGIRAVSNGSANIYSGVERTDNAFNAAFRVTPSGTLSPTNVQWWMGMVPNNNYFSFGMYEPGLPDVASKMVITNTGNVGIGTTGPGNKLQVTDATAAQALFNGWDETTGAYHQSGQILLGDTVAYQGRLHYNSGGNLYLDNSYNNDAGNIYIRTKTAGTAVNAVTILGSGNVGIGTTAPGSRLHIYKGASGQTPNASSLLTVENGNQAFVQILTPSTINASSGFMVGDELNSFRAGLVHNQVSAITTIRGDGTDTIFMKGGNVGIGATPTYSLSFGNGAARKFWIENSATDVVGRALTVAAGGTIAGTSTSDVVGGQLILQSGLGTGTGDSSIAFQTGTTLTTGTTLQTMSTKMTILGNGNVGIGSTGPTARLQIVGADDLSTSYAAKIGGATTTGLVVNNLGNVGIGTTSPGGKLEVAGEVRSTSQFTLYSGSTYRASISDQSTFTGIYGDGNGTAASPNIAIKSGNVGIGTTAPVAKLDIYGSTGESNGIKLDAAGWPYYNRLGQNGTTGSQLILSQNYSFANSSVDSASYATNAIVLDNVSNPAINFMTGVANTAPTAKLSILQNGNVGIGTTSPGYALDVNGSINSNRLRLVRSTGSASLPVMNYGDTLGGAVTDNLSIGNTGGAALLFHTNTTERMRIDSSGNVGIGSTGPTARLQIVGADDLSTSYAAKIGGATTTGLVVNNLGNVGIGTTSPGAPLDVVGNMYVHGGVGLYTNSIRDYDGTGFLLDTGAAGAVAVTINNHNTGTITGDLLRVNANSVTKVVVNSTGNVGIGTTSPTNILSLGNGAARKFWIENSATDVVGRALTVAAGGTIAGTSTSDVTGGQLILQSGLGTGTGDSSISFQTGTTLTTGTTLQTMSTKMTILGNGNVGIGTTNPLTKLQIAGGSTTSASELGSFLVTGSTSSMRLAMGVDNTSTMVSWIQSVENGTLARTLALNPLGGNVGIGTATPGAKLQVLGVGSGSVVASSGVTDATMNGRFCRGTACTDVGIIDSGTSYIQSRNNADFSSNFHLALQPNGGNVGIGTLSPNRKLEVNGSIRMGALITGAGSAVAVYRDVNGDLADSTSSIRFKTDVSAMENVLPSIMSLSAVRFKWGQNTSTPGENDFGMIAEDVNNILPDLVTYNPNGSVRGLKYEKMGVFALKGIQELENQVFSQMNVLGDSLRITDSQGNVQTFGNRDISASQNREMTLSAQNINLNGNVFANGLNLGTAISGLTDNQNKIVSQLTGQLADENLSINEKLNLIGENLDNLQQDENAIATLKDQFANQDITLGELKSQLDALDTSNSAILGQINTDALINLTVALNTDLMIYKDAAGNVNIGSGKIIADEVQARSAEFEGGVVAGAFSVKVIDKDAPTIGSAEICPAGQKFDSIISNCVASTDPADDGKTVEIKTTAVTANSKIFVTAKGVTGQPLSVTKITAGTSFKVEVKDQVPSELKFDWWVVEEK